MYQSVWRCRLCGQRFVGEVGFEEKEIAALLDKDVLEHRISFHSCYGGSIGISDFVGFEKYKDHVE